MKPPIGQAWVDRGLIPETPPDPETEPCPICGQLVCMPPVATVERVWSDEEREMEIEANRPVVVVEELWEDAEIGGVPTRKLKYHKGQVITRREAEADKGLSWTEQDQPQVRGGIETKG